MNKLIKKEMKFELKKVKDKALNISYGPNVIF